MATAQQQAMLDALRRRASGSMMPTAPSGMGPAPAPQAPALPAGVANALSIAQKMAPGAAGAMNNVVQTMGYRPPSQGAAASAAMSAANATIGQRIEPRDDMMVRDPNAPGGMNTHQMSAQARAVMDEMRRRATMSNAQKMVEDRGVFAGQQQGVTMPALPNGGALPALF